MNLLIDLMNLKCQMIIKIIEELEAKEVELVELALALRVIHVLAF